ncbi:hypothetical protein GOBAR_AA04073 [Gossypium barbadense]|uniref:Magnesium transporter n=1 Tax=Gossypium barbadense TaxID=3634 RepID=A0A2P5YLN9_GOSBA|nr:hypothetical protein GOBAR_AA04073 [Gossypium barbadense]
MAREAYLVPVVEAQVATLKKKTAVTTSWISIDAKGQSVILDVDKYAIMRRVQVHARDLRILDPMLSYPSTILGREKVIVLNLEHIKAIITAEEVKFPFEFRALEVALEAICSFLDARTRELEIDAYPALDELTSKVIVGFAATYWGRVLALKQNGNPIWSQVLSKSKHSSAKISSRNLDRVRKLKSAMTRLTNRVQKVRDELEQLLDDDDDMADLYLSRKLAGACSPVSSFSVPSWYPPSPTIGSKISRTSRASAVTVEEDNDVEELEMLLEAYFMQIDSTLNKLTTLREYIDDTEDYINIQLDNHRNQLIQLELFVSSGTVCLSIYSLVAAIFGMNIPYTWKEGHEYMFKWVVILTGLLCTSTFTSIVSYARHKGLIGS